ncbi:hypothetical protein ACFW42_30070, partial [Streptomyces albidoflavus]
MPRPGTTPPPRPGHDLVPGGTAGGAGPRTRDEGRAARELLAGGTYDALADAVPYPEMQGLL